MTELIIDEADNVKETAEIHTDSETVCFVTYYWDGVWVEDSRCCRDIKDILVIAAKLKELNGEIV